MSTPPKEGDTLGPHTLGRCLQREHTFQVFEQAHGSRWVETWEGLDPIDFNDVIEDLGPLFAFYDPHAPQISGAEMIEGRLVLTLAQNDGTTLADHLETEGPLPIWRAEILFNQLADLLAEFQKHGIHPAEGLSPSNIWLTQSRTGADIATLIGWHRPLFMRRLAKARSIKATNAPDPGLIFLDPAFTPPEVLSDLVDAPKSGPYVLSHLLCAMLLGHPLVHNRNSPLETVLHVLNGNLDLDAQMADYKETLLEPLRAALALDPQQRPDLEDFTKTMRTAIQKHISGFPTPPPPWTHDEFKGPILAGNPKGSRYVTNTQSAQDLVERVLNKTNQGGTQSGRLGGGATSKIINRLIIPIFIALALTTGIILALFWFFGGGIR